MLNCAWWTLSYRCPPQGTEPTRSLPWWPVSHRYPPVSHRCPLTETCLDGLHLEESYADDPHLIKVYFGELHLTRVLPWWTVSHKCPHFGSLLWWTAPYKKLSRQAAPCRGLPQWVVPHKSPTLMNCISHWDGARPKASRWASRARSCT